MAGSKEQSIVSILLDVGIPINVANNLVVDGVTEGTLTLVDIDVLLKYGIPPFKADIIEKKIQERARSSGHAARSHKTPLPHPSAPAATAGSSTSSSSTGSSSKIGTKHATPRKELKPSTKKRAKSSTEERAKSPPKKKAKAASFCPRPATPPLEVHRVLPPRNTVPHMKVKLRIPRDGEGIFGARQSDYVGIEHGKYSVGASTFKFTVLVRSIGAQEWAHKSSSHLGEIYDALFNEDGSLKAPELRRLQPPPGPTIILLRDFSTTGRMDMRTAILDDLVRELALRGRWGLIVYDHNTADGDVALPFLNCGFRHISESPHPPNPLLFLSTSTMGCTPGWLVEKKKKAPRKETIHSQLCSAVREELQGKDYTLPGNGGPAQMFMERGDVGSFMAIVRSYVKKGASLQKAGVLHDCVCGEYVSGGVNELVSVLISNYPSCLDTLDIDGHTPLMVAAGSRMVDATYKQLEHWIKNSKYKESVSSLLQQGADVAAEGSCGRDAFDIHSLVMDKYCYVLPTSLSRDTVISHSVLNAIRPLNANVCAGVNCGKCIESFTRIRIEDEEEELGYQCKTCLRSDLWCVACALSNGEFCSGCDGFYCNWCCDVPLYDSFGKMYCRPSCASIEM